ncbi:uncharacterized protein LOC129567169 [Sitodiplosis mosellana]|uniref:uncharacterized protein LOC129567169 n=1 Tax=Sitodiplosis mosellana TaxID=263140 RepID=UPI002445167A|nr:uncharacterized protein LOC129567169 [Sitodiplosis mosellana]
MVYMKVKIIFFLLVASTFIESVLLVPSRGRSFGSSGGGEGRGGCHGRKPRPTFVQPMPQNPQSPPQTPPSQIPPYLMALFQQFVAALAAAATAPPPANNGTA